MARGRKGHLRVARLGAHLIQRGTAELPEAPDNVSIIGCDAANGTYFQCTPTSAASAVSTR